MTMHLKRLALLLLVVTTIGCDRVSKHYAAATLAGTSGHSWLADTVRFQYAENTGAFLGLGDTWPPAVRTSLFTIGNAVIMVAIVAAAIRFRWSGPTLVGLGLYLAGGGSNLADRVMRGHVIDFMNVGLGPVRTGIFNVADMAILLGVAIVVVTHRRRVSEDGNGRDGRSSP